MRKALATIITGIGTMTIYFNGAGNEMTAENGDYVEEIGYKPTSKKDAINAINEMYDRYYWDLTWMI